MNSYFEKKKKREKEELNEIFIMNELIRRCLFHV